MSTVSNMVQDHVKDLYARMATVAAKNAVAKAHWGNADEAESWAGVAERWLIRAGANATRYTYQEPKV